MASEKDGRRTTHEDVSDEVDGVVTFLSGDFSGGTGMPRDGFDVRLRLPKKYEHPEGGIDTGSIPKNLNHIASIRDGADYVKFDDWEAGESDRFHVVVIYRPRYEGTEQNLTIYADGEVTTDKRFRAGDVLRRTINADSLAFDAGEPEKTAPLGTEDADAQ